MDGEFVFNAEGKPIKKYAYTLHQKLSDSKSNPMKWLHTAISNLKSELQGIYHGIPIQYLKLYLCLNKL